MLPKQFLAWIVALALVDTCLLVAPANQSARAAAGAAGASQSAFRLVAEARQRIEHGRLEIRVYRSGRPVELPRFTELLVVRPVGPGAVLEEMVQETVAVVPSEKHKGRWHVYRDVVWRRSGRTATEGDLMTLPENIFVVSQVLVCSEKKLITVRTDGAIHPLKPGEALLVLK